VPDPEPDPDPVPDLELGPEDRELRATLLALFAQHGGNVVAVAAALGKRRAQIYRWIKRFAIDLTAFRADDRS
jgi:transcriptional regulator of acetoin/glycerol metabolism